MKTLTQNIKEIDYAKRVRQAEIKQAEKMIRNNEIGPLPDVFNAGIDSIGHDSIHVVGINRGNARVWLQAKWLISSNFSKGTVYHVHYGSGKITIMKSIPIVADLKPKGRKVAGSIDRPIIDLNSKKVTDSLEGASNVRVVARWNKIEIFKS